MLCYIYEIVNWSEEQSTVKVCCFCFVKLNHIVLQENAFKGNCKQIWEFLFCVLCFIRFHKNAVLQQNAISLNCKLIWGAVDCHGLLALVTTWPLTKVSSALALSFACPTVYCIHLLFITRRIAKYCLVRQHSKSIPYAMHVQCTMHSCSMHNALSTYMRWGLVPRAVHCHCGHFDLLVPASVVSTIQHLWAGPLTEDLSVCNPNWTHCCLASHWQTMLGREGHYHCW